MSAQVKGFVADPEIGKANVRAALARLEHFVATLATPDTLKGALRRGSKGNLHRYSLRTQALMLLHRPGATEIGTFKYWLSKGRMVKKGEGTHLLMPRQFVVKDEADEDTPGAVVDAETGEAYVERMVRCFKAVMYWDIADTTDRKGNPYTPPPPSAPRYGKTRISDQLNGSEGENERALVIAAETRLFVLAQGCDFTWGKYSGAYGAYSPSRNAIIIDPDQLPIKLCGTVVHEAAHLMERVLGTRDTYDLGELVAEGVAFTVLARYDLDTSAFSFGYVERYGANKAMFAKGVKAIQRIANAIIEGIEAEEASQEEAA
jgi:hypothetical protein